MTVNQSQIQSMAAIMDALNKAENDQYAPSKNSKKTGDAQMSQIMESFRKATENVIEESHTNQELKIALETERLDDGVRIGSWRIVIGEDVSYGKSYDVIHNITNEPIASSLRLYEAALALVSSLNDGETITSGRVKSIIALESDYSKALGDAVSFSKRMKITEGAQHDIAQARYDDAKRKALIAKKSISKLV